MATSTKACEMFRFRLELTDSRNAVVAQRDLPQGDFNRAVAATYLNALRRGLVNEYQPAVDTAQVIPRFGGDGESSRAEGFRVVIPTPSGEPFASDFALAYFAPEAARLRAQSAPAKVNGNDSADSDWSYALQAFLDDRQNSSVQHSGAIELGPTTTMVSLLKRSLSELGPLMTWDNPSPSAMPILVARSVVDETCEEARRHPDREVGGLLLGHVCQDGGQVFTQITCLVSAEGTTESTATTITFTPESFQRAREMIALRASGGLPAETVLGWHHTHPFRLCQECPLPTPPECLDKIFFFSKDDVQVMSTTFYQPFMAGLLSGVDPRLERALGHPPVRCFYWNDGEIVRGGFSVFED